ncbi:rCG38473 [Rattus norvegicus]|uniref:RCG38473 n=1 Tax=Rattus norvegicus TaxID=10116 RepID=A6KM12_RAT|nr:rCG38473 [Rattus norvegicus]
MPTSQVRPEKLGSSLRALWRETVQGLWLIP